MSAALRAANLRANLRRIFPGGMIASHPEKTWTQATLNRNARAGRIRTTVTMRRGTRAGSLLGAVALSAVLLSGCASAGGAPDLTSLFPSRQSSGSGSRPPPDDRSAFRSIPIRTDSTVDILTPANLYDLYSEILQTYVDPVDSGTLIEVALKGIESGATDQGISPLDIDMMELMSVRV